MRLLATLLTFAMLATGGLADTPRKIGWGDLAEGLSAVENPYYGLSADEARLVGVLVDTARMREAGEHLFHRLLQRSLSDECCS